MNVNLRALIFGTTIACALTATMNVVAAETPRVNRLEAVQVTAHRDVDANAEPEVIRLEGVVVTAHKNVE